MDDWQKKSVSLDATPKETAVSRRLLLLGRHLFFGSGFRRGLLGFGFCGHSVFLLQVYRPAECKFLRRLAHHADYKGECKHRIITKK